MECWAIVPIKLKWGRRILILIVYGKSSPPSPLNNSLIFDFSIENILNSLLSISHFSFTQIKLIPQLLFNWFENKIA
ncbi:unnamed protein product [Blepharisma stoltei]|uniref:Uncharacterized protein n=1 Tax=Blepharisma stoltei TaxID=1481888 RepID=A0AAU9JIU9_9CILI|nr:unnamed protein product [Blepharisma stoltei]